MAKENCYLNGEFLNLAEAKISVLDRGFLFGDGVYELLPVYRRRPFQWQWHIERLRRSLHEIRLSPDLTDTLRQPAQELIDRYTDENSSLYIQITRGAEKIRRHAFGADIKPTIFMSIWQRPPVAEEKVRDGVSCLTMEDFRWRRGDIKCTSLLAAVLIADDSAKSDAEETILLRDGKVMEGASSNVIIVVNGQLYCPVPDNRLLRGITYQTAVVATREIGITAEERDITRGELAAADEIWLASSTREIMPVTELDGQIVGGGRPGEIFKLVHAAFTQKILALSDGG